MELTRRAALVLVKEFDNIEEILHWEKRFNTDLKIGLMDPEEHRALTFILGCKALQLKDPKINLNIKFDIDIQINEEDI